MSYMYGVRGTCKATPLTESIRQELYPAPYESIDWNAARSLCAKEDLYYPRPLVQVGVNGWPGGGQAAAYRGGLSRRWIQRSSTCGSVLAE